MKRASFASVSSVCVCFFFYFFFNHSIPEILQVFFFLFGQPAKLCSLHNRYFYLDFVLARRDNDK